MTLEQIVAMGDAMALALVWFTGVALFDYLFGDE